MVDIRKGVMERTREEVFTERNSDFVHTFSGPHGERSLKFLSKFCLENETTFVENSGRKSDFNDGARSVILEIRYWMNFDLTKLNKESSNE